MFCEEVWAGPPTRRSPMVTARRRRSPRVPLLSLRGQPNRSAMRGLGRTDFLITVSLMPGGNIILWILPPWAKREGVSDLLTKNLPVPTSALRAGAAR
ncbi:hypothetical protein SFRURICE_013646 [Spodoptera frugiperda]|nr:hypothetical protein SFRURICE_013646 [Spodoptera frugiperda]